jgi:HD-GYP domain-containing protein (c-di-GMP phosphodiesterase class II)
MRRHPDLGACLLAAVGLPPGVVAAVRYHHERFDGTGYPTGLAGWQIPQAARIIAVADAFDVMTATRPYRAALAPVAAVAELVRHRGTQFDPDVVDTFAATWPDLLPAHPSQESGGPDRGGEDVDW